jgi:hypothetical protein
MELKIKLYHFYGGFYFDENCGVLERGSQLYEVGEIVGIELVDYIIIGKDFYSSLKEVKGYV